MPCVFWEPRVMVIHAALVTQRIQTLARGAPAVLIGDFNFKPGDAAYNLVTRTLPPHSPYRGSIQTRPTLVHMQMM
jgi:endonuclease/exonuclease/phosphatase family metal-dependent hydrolase